MRHPLILQLDSTPTATQSSQAATAAKYRLSLTHSLSHTRTHIQGFDDAFAADLDETPTATQSMSAVASGGFKVCVCVRVCEGECVSER